MAGNGRTSEVSHALGVEGRVQSRPPRTTARRRALSAAGRRERPSELAKAATAPSRSSTLLGPASRRKPSCSRERMAPPGVSAASSSVTGTPWRCSDSARARPEMPPPTTTVGCAEGMALWVEVLHLPGSVRGVPGEDLPLVEAVLTADPEFDEVRHQAKARPVRWPWNGLPLVLGLDFGEARLQRRSAGQRGALVRGPRADLAPARPGSEVGDPLPPPRRGVPGPPRAPAAGAAGSSLNLGGEREWSCRVQSRSDSPDV